MTSPNQGAIGTGLAVALTAAWAMLHIWGVFFHPLAGAGLAAAPVLIAIICWLNVGLFIIAHDAMHGSLLPGRPGFNRAVGRLALFLYAGFSFDRLRPKHMAHHKAPGTGDDPDFSEDHPRHFWPWYRRFMLEYFGLRELAVLSLLVALYVAVLRAPMANLLLFWALPAILSSLQLFYFGTYRPHRHEDRAFADAHHARSSSYGWLASLMTCFHFGYHHEHHLAPHVPWWRLPAERCRRALPR